jgi:hypothetical protein
MRRLSRPASLLLAPTSASLLLLALVLWTPVATAQYIEPVWGPEEIVDTGPIDITSSSGPGIVHTADWAPWASLDEWHVVYAKDGDIYHAVRTSAGWQAPEALTADPVISKDPKIAFMRDRLVVVWEDDRRGHPEIWVREWYAGAWGAEVGLADDAIPSRSPVIAGTDAKGFAAWEEGEDGATHIAARGYSSTGWGGVAAISTGPAPAIEPTVSYSLALDHLIVAWADARHGDYEIYINQRESGSWWGETRLTNLPGACRRPSVNVQTCCSDVEGVMSMIVFENDATGVPEIWTGYAYLWSPEVGSRISADDGRASVRPQICGYPVRITVGMEGTVPRYPVTWTEDGEAGAREHLLGMVDAGIRNLWTDTLSTTGLGTSGVGAVRAGTKARLVTVWLEERDGQTTLIAKPGEAMGCDGMKYTAPPSILLTPGGTRGNTIRWTDACAGGAPVEGVETALEFDPTLDPLLAWDVGQPHPTTQIVPTGADGFASVIVRGGGCSATGRVYLCANGDHIRSWTGAKSPDVNGDCEVGPYDVAYVTGKLGTTDFCADLDGSGSVTAADVAIVEATLGEVCSQLSAVGDPAEQEGGAGARGLRITPNPARGVVEIRIERDETGGSDGSAAAQVRIFDAAGRLVREFDASGSGGGATLITWDGRDGEGRPVPPGLYYVRSGRTSGRAGTGVVVVR